MSCACKFRLWMGCAAALLAAVVVAAAQGTETFDNFSYSEATYTTVTNSFLGQDGSTWYYFQCQGSKVITAPTPGLNRGTPIAFVESGWIAGGCGTLSFDWMQMNNPTVSVDVVINGTIRHTLTVTNGVKDLVTNSGPLAINQSGSFTLRFQQHSSQSRQVAIDNITWTAYGGSTPEPPELLFSPETNGVVTAYSNQIQLSVTATEPNTDSVRLWASNLPAGVIFIGATNTSVAASTFQWTPTSVQTGTYSVVFYAGDKDGTNSRAFSIEVTPIYPYYHYAEGLTGAVLKAKLHDIISAGAIQLNVDQENESLKAIHTDPDNTNNVLLLYTEDSRLKSAYNAPTGGWNKEHCWPESRGLLGTGPDQIDVHNLYAADSDVNNLRGALYFDESDPATAGYENPATNTALLTSLDINSFEPPPNFKGNVARAIFYMATRYDGSDLNTAALYFTDTPASNNAPAMGILRTLLLWNAMDAPDDWERTRNELIYTNFQHNRNPFVDRPEWAESIWGTDSDSDGINDTYEIIAGTATNNLNSRFEASFEATLTSTQVVCSLLSSGSVWRLYEGTLAGQNIAWRQIAETNRLQAGTLRFNVAPTSPATFYHLRAYRP